MIQRKHAARRAQFGVDISFVDASDTEAVRAAIRPETALIFLGERVKDG